MIINFIKRDIKGFFDIFKNKKELVLLLAMMAFVLVNVVKITVFNYYLMSDKTLELFSYKLKFTMLVACILYPLLFMFRARMILVLFYALQTVYILVNSAYYFYFHNYFHINESLQVLNEGIAAIKNFSAPLHPAMLLILIDLPILIYIVRKYKGCPVIVRKTWAIVLSVMILSACGIAAIEKQNFAEKVSFKQSIKNYYEGESDIIERYGTLFNNGVNIYNNQDYSYLANNFVYGETVSADTSTKRHPNIIFVQVESLDANIIEQMHDGQYVAPYLHALTDNSVYYPYTMSYHLGGSTSDTEFSVINSVQPLADYPSIKLANYDYSNSMVKVLAENAYSTYAFHGNVGGFFNRNRAFPKMGFQQFYDISAMGLTEQGWGASDGDVFDYTIAKLKEAQKPFFSYTITMTSHGPFTNAANYYENPLFDDVSKKRVRNYYNSIAYVDQQLEKFVGEVRKNFGNTYIIIMGDHTPSIKSGPYTQAAFAENDRYFEFVPLFVITPDQKKYKETRMAASFLDIAPTILNASRIDYEIKSDGLDLLAYPNANRNVPYLGASYDRYSLYAKVPRTYDETGSRVASAETKDNH